METYSQSLRVTRNYCCVQVLQNLWIVSWDKPPKRAMVLIKIAYIFFWFQLGKLFMIEQLKLRDIKLVGSIPLSFVEFSDLVHPDLSSNLISGTIPSLLYQLPKNREL